jgi:hypothetical protein
MLIQVTWLTVLLFVAPFAQIAKQRILEAETVTWSSTNVDWDDPVAASIALALQERTPALNSNALWEVWSDSFKFKLPAFSFFQLDYCSYSMISLLYGYLLEPDDKILYHNESPIRCGSEYSHPRPYVPSIWELLHHIPLRVGTM